MNKSSQQGILLAVLAYFMWGLAPVYFKAMGQVPALEMVSHRVIWSFLFLFLLLVGRKALSQCRELFSNPKVLGYLLLSSVTIAINWLVFIWAITQNKMLEASLGYYINPLVNVLLGMLFLQERLARLQWVAVALAGIGVVIQLIHFGSIPWVALILAFSFGFYGLLRKQVKVESISGLWLETGLLFPFALGFLLMNTPDTAPMQEYSVGIQLGLIAAGLITTVPLLCFIGAAKRLPLSQLGFIQYIGPSCMFILATCFYDEPFTQDKLITFVFIWSALGVFSWHAWRTYRTTPK